MIHIITISSFFSFEFCLHYMPLVGPIVVFKKTPFLRLKKLYFAKLANIDRKNPLNMII